jgi:hypothetical protein
MLLMFSLIYIRFRCSYFNSSIISAGGTPKVSGIYKVQTITKTQLIANERTIEIPINWEIFITGGIIATAE